MLLQVASGQRPKVLPNIRRGTGKPTTTKNNAGPYVSAETEQILLWAVLLHLSCACVSPKVMQCISGIPHFSPAPRWRWHGWCMEYQGSIAHVVFNEPVWHSLCQESVFKAPSERAAWLHPSCHGSLYLHEPQNPAESVRWPLLRSCYQTLGLSWKLGAGNQFWELDWGRARFSGWLRVWPMCTEKWRFWTREGERENREQIRKGGREGLIRGKCQRDLTLVPAPPKAPDELPAPEFIPYLYIQRSHSFFFFWLK